MSGNSQTLTTKLVVDDEASRPTEEYAKILDGLDGDTATVVLALKAASVKQDLDQLLADVAELDSSDPTVDVKIEQAAAAKSELDDLKAKIQEINSQPVDVDTKPAQQGVKDLGTESDSTRSVMANMVGNTTQDLGNLGGVAGSAGVAIGQIGEYAAEGQIPLGSLVKMAGPMALLAGAGMLVSEVLGDIAKTKAFHHDQVDKWLAALKEGKSTVEAIRDDMEETSRIEFISSGDVKDATGSLDRLKLTAEEFLDAVKDPAVLQSWRDQKAAVEETVDSLMRTRTEMQAAFGPERQAELDAAQLKVKDYRSAIDAAEQKIKDTGDATAKLEQETRVYGDTARSAKDDTEEHTAAQRRAKEAIDDLGESFDGLRGKMDMEQAQLNFTTAMQTAQTAARSEIGLTQQELIDTKNAIIDVADTADLNPVDVRMALQKVDQGDIDGAYMDIQNALNKKGPFSIKLKAELNANAIVVTGAGGGNAARPGSITVPPQTITVNLPRGSRSSDISRAMSAHTRRAGRRYGAPVVTRAR